MEQSITRLYQGELPARQTYIAGRLEEQISYYDKKSLKNKKLYYGLTMLSVAANALIPILSLYISTPNKTAKLLITCLSSLTAIVSSFLMVLNSKNLWLKYRKNANNLTSLLHQYYARAGIFSGLSDEAAFEQLVEQSEGIFNLESEGWSSLFIKKEGREKEESA